MTQSGRLVGSRIVPRIGKSQFVVKPANREPKVFCFKVSVNGRLVCVAGLESKDSLSVSIREGEGHKPHIIVGGRKRESTYSYDKTYIFGTQNLELNDSVTVELANVDEVDQPIEIHTQEFRDRLNMVDGLLATYAWDDLAKVLHTREPHELRPPKPQQREWRPEHLEALGIKPRDDDPNKTVEQAQDDGTADGRLPPEEKRTFFCSFCGKSNNEVQKLIAGPSSVFICDECVELCQEIIAEELQGTTGEQPSDEEAELQWGLWPRNQQ